MRNPRRFIWLILLFVSVTIIYAQNPPPTRIRFAQFSSDVGPIDVYIDGELLLDDFTFPDLTDWQEITIAR